MFLKVVFIGTGLQRGPCYSQVRTEIPHRENGAAMVSILVCSTRVHVPSVFLLAQSMESVVFTYW